jgi:hypothetical protein
MKGAIARASRAEEQLAILKAEMHASAEGSALADLKASLAAEASAKRRLQEQLAKAVPALKKLHTQNLKLRKQRAVLAEAVRKLRADTGDAASVSDTISEGGSTVAEGVYDLDISFGADSLGGDSDGESTGKERSKSPASVGGRRRASAPGAALAMGHAAAALHRPPKHAQ